MLNDADMLSPHANLWEAFDATVRAEPSAAALIFPDRAISFETLAAQAERCAAWFAALGLRRGEVVALQLPKRPETFALWLGCLRQGLIYVFIDPRNPPERTRKMLDRVRPALLVTTGEEANPHGRICVLPVVEHDSWIEGLAPAAVAPAAASLHGLDPAYIMFTSGSTGEPKGAVIPQQGVLGLMRWARGAVRPPPGTRFSNLNPLHFDNSVFDLYCGLVSGFALVPIDTGAVGNPVAWLKRLRSAQASVMFAVPTLFLTLDSLHLLSPDSLPDLRVALFGGEGYPVGRLRNLHERFVGRARLINVYGPTETSCICSSIEIDSEELKAAGDGFASLGRMHAGFDHAILDDMDTPVRLGEVGELWIGGSHVGLGYYANPSETAARFRQDPRQDQYRSIWYRSGDLVREDEKGRLWFQGRTDNQVKIRGHRIELEEIDLAVEQVPEIRRAVCAVVTGEDGPELRLAFTATQQVQIDVVRDFCAAKLPSYMQPMRFAQVEHLPENANGKVDRKAVRAMMETKA
jgi:D-alanine--poly(phosphoribitol) ligase subunit 1